jgi:hypothetical protein
MSEAEIQYLVPKESRDRGDLETLLNGMGAYGAELPHYVDQFAVPTDEAHGSAMVRLIRSSHKPRPEYELREDAEQMRRGVESHLSEEDRARIAKLFVGIAIADATETE